MKKSLIRVAFAAAFVAISGYGIYANQKTDSMSELMLANVEALADDDETSDYGTLYGNSSGTLYCCCPGESRTCGAAKCTNC